MLNATEVLKRMKAGDLPTRRPYGLNVEFKDGETASLDVMRYLDDKGLVEPPFHSSIYSAFTLKEPHA